METRYNVGAMKTNYYIVRYGCYRGECDFGLGPVKEAVGDSIRDLIQDEIDEGQFCNEGEEFQEVGVVNEVEGIGGGSFNCEEGVMVVREDNGFYQRIKDDLNEDGTFSHDLLEELNMSIIEY